MRYSLNILNKFLKFHLTKFFSFFVPFSGKYLMLIGYGPHSNINSGNYDIRFDNECTAHWENQRALNAQYA